MDTTTNKAIRLFKEGKIHKSLNIFKTFKNSFNRDEKRAIQITAESINNHSRGDFYQSLGIDVSLQMDVALNAIMTNFINK